MRKINFDGSRVPGGLRDVWLLLRPLVPFWLLLPLILTACDAPFVFQQKKEIPAGQWAYGDTLDFRFAISDTAQTYNLYLDFEHADTFATQNVYLKLHTLFPDGKRPVKVTSFNFFDAQGASLGECSGHECRLHTMLQENAYFNQPGEYMITLEQYTRRDPLPGIYSVGVSIETTGIKR